MKEIILALILAVLASLFAHEAFADTQLDKCREQLETAISYRNQFAKVAKEEAALRVEYQTKYGNLYVAAYAYIQYAEKKIRRQRRKIRRLKR